MAGKTSSVQSEYMFSRSFRDSARQAILTISTTASSTDQGSLRKRLHLQHWIWKERLGYLLHPSVPRSALSCKVADVGTGNA